MFDEINLDRRYGERSAAQETAASAENDPVLSLIAEERRIESLAIAARTRAEEILFALPEDIRKGRAHVSLSGPFSCCFRDSFSSEQDLQLHLELYRRLATIHERVQFDRDIGLDRALDQLRAGLDEIKAVREASGREEYCRQAEALDEQASAILDQIRETKPVTLAGAIAMLEQEYAEELIAPVLEGLRDLRARGGGAL